MKQTITATFEKAFYRKEESGWGIYKTNQGTVKGKIPWKAKEGQILKLSGEFCVSEFNGKNEFVFQSAYPSLPEDSRALLAYVVSITQGLGPKREQEIWEKYGDKWQDTADGLKISGLSENVQWHWQDSLSLLESEKVQSQTFGWLLSVGCSMNMATAAWKKWGDTTYGKVDENCYVLAELPFYGFQDVDKAIRKKFGIDDLDYRRIDAAVLYVLRNKITDGSTFVPWERLSGELAKIVASASDLFETSLDRLIQQEKIEKIIATNSEVGFSLAEDAQNERIIAERFGL